MNDNNNDILLAPTAFMPDGTPAPYVLTAGEAVTFLRLDTNGTKNPKAALDYYQKKGLLRPITIGKCRKYPLPELLRFIDRLSQLKENVA